MKLKIILPGQIRIKKNSKRIYGSGKFKKVLPSRAYKNWEKQARNFITEQMILNNILYRFPIETQISVKATIYFKGPRMDLSGAMESIGDCLEGLIWKNDRQIESWDGSRLIRDLDPRCEIYITDFLGDKNNE